jgi:hypothetical protein
MLDALEAVIQAGKVRYVAASSMWAWQFAKLREMQKARDYQQFVAMQNFYNLAYREEEREMMPYCASEGVACRALVADRARVPGRQPAEGRPSDQPGRYRQDGAGLLRLGAGLCHPGRVEKVAAKLGVKPAQVAYAWVLSKPYVTSPIVGATRIGQLDEAIGALDVKLDAASVRLLEGPTSTAERPACGILMGDRNQKIERVQTGLRIEKRLLKVLKGLAEHLDISVAELIEALALHAFEGKAPFGAETIVQDRPAQGSVRSRPDCCRQSRPERAGAEDDDRLLCGRCFEQFERGALDPGRLPPCRPCRCGL